jgi:hypothetical protein
MTDRPQTTGDDRSQDAPADGFRRREFVALGAGVSATMLAGCAGDGGLTSSDGSDGSDGSQTLTGNFRLLISDAPADIDDFDRLDVTLDQARVFEARDEDDEGDEEEESDDAEGDDEEDGADQTANETETESDSPNGTADEDDDAEEEDEDDDADAEDDEEGEDDGDDAEEDDENGDRGFTVVDLDDATVDLTQVIDEDAMAVFDGEIPAGSYEKIELSVTSVDGIVDGEEVDVKLPSEKLQITNGFEVTPDEPVSFVFDINVVKRGQNNGYILKPVISGSGVAGRDVDVNEIDDDDDEDESDDEEESAEEDDDADEESTEEDDGAAENETDDAENETADGS